MSERKWYEFADVFSHVDEMLIELKTVLMQILERLPERGAIIPGPAPIRPTPGVVPTPTAPPSPERDIGRPTPIEVGVDVEIPTTLIDGITQLLSWTMKVHTALGEIKSILEDEIGSKEDYFLRETTVVNTDHKTYNILSLLGRPARYGHLISDDGVIIFSINSESEITVNAGEQYSFDGKNHKINDILIRTDSAAALSFRLILS